MKSALWTAPPPPADGTTHSKTKQVAAGDDQQNLIGTYSTDSGELLCRLVAHTTPIWAIAFVTEQEVWTSEFDDCVRVWNIMPSLQAQQESRKQVAADGRLQTGLDAIFRQGRVDVIAVSP
jgi:WD40 repeat protein